jgi:hypothetical protein
MSADLTPPISSSRLRSRDSLPGLVEGESLERIGHFLNSPDQGATVLFGVYQLLDQRLLDCLGCGGNRQPLDDVGVVAETQAVVCVLRRVPQGLSPVRSPP